MKGEHFAAITDAKRVPDLLRSIYAYEGTLTVKSALRLAPWYSFARRATQRSMADIDLDAAEWRFTVSKRKRNISFRLPASGGHPQGTATAHRRRALRLPRRTKPEAPMSENAILAALRGMGIPREEMSGHGFRAMARTCWMKP